MSPNWNCTGSLPYSHFFSAETVRARELLHWYNRLDSVEDLMALLWPCQWLIPKRYRNLRMRRMELRSKVVFWGGRVPRR